MNNKYKKKPVIIEAIQFTGAPSVDYMFDEWGARFQRALSAYQEDNTIIIKTLEGDHRANIRDWIIKGVKGEFYPCKPDVFELTYEAVNDPAL